MKSKFEKELKDKVYNSVPDKWDEFSKVTADIEIPEAENSTSGKTFKIKKAQTAAVAAAAVVLIAGAGIAVNTVNRNKVALDTAESEEAQIKDDTEISDVTVLSEEAFLGTDGEEVIINYTDENGETHTAVASVEESVTKDGKAVVTYKDYQGNEQTAVVKIPEVTPDVEGDVSPAGENYDSFNETAAATSYAATTYKGESWIEPDFSNRTTPGKFPGVKLDGTEYAYPFSWVETGNGTKRSASKIKSGVTVENYDHSDKKITTTADIYSLSGFNKKLVIGVKFKGENEIYPYINTTYKPATLGEFLNAIDYDNTVTYGNIQLMNLNMPLNAQNKADIKKYLLSDKSAKNVETMPSGEYVTASINLTELGISNKSFKIYESGYITTNLIGYQYTFYVGKDNVASFLKNSYNVTFDELRKTGTTLPTDIYGIETTSGYTEKYSQANILE